MFISSVFVNKIDFVEPDNVDPIVTENPGAEILKQIELLRKLTKYTPIFKDMDEHVQRDGRYLYYNYTENPPIVGINHWVNNLQSFLQNALALRRIPIIGAVMVDCVKHHHGNECARSAYNWETYYDMYRSSFTIQDPSSNETIVHSTFKYYYDWDFKFSRYSEHACYFYDNEPIPDEVNDLCRLIIRVINEELLWDNLNVKGNIPLKNGGNGDIKIALQLSKPILEIGEKLLDDLKFQPKKFGVIHARRGDRLQIDEDCASPTRRRQSLKDGTTPKAIYETLLAYKLPVGTYPVYIMTNEANPLFFVPLLTLGVNVRQYFDSEDLRNLYMTNNFQLYLVEKHFLLENSAFNVYSFMNPVDMNDTEGEFRYHLTDCLGWT